MTPHGSSFSERWQQSAAGERANYQLFLSELCDFLDVPRPDPTRAEGHVNTYVFEKHVTFHNVDGTTSQGRIDLYRRGHFVLEAKQGSNPPELQPNPKTGDLVLTPPVSRPARQRRGTAVRGTHGWDEAMVNAYNQAERYAKALPATEGWPPFLVTVDVGHSIELFADFSLTGKAYLPFPDARTYRILLSDLANPDNRERLRLVWTDPHALNPARHAAKVTREVADKLAVLARTLEQKYSPKQVAEFLTRCIFTSFAEDVKLLSEKSWYNLLCDLRDADKVAVFPEMAKSLWDTMNDGGFSPILKAHVLRFNGGLFESTEALPLTSDQLALLIDAADSDWKDVEPAIFGTLLERALDADERHQLGAHYTPRAYVERLVIPTIVEPLRADWADVIAAVSELVASGHPADAIDILRDFHRRLCNTRVLDPACGSGNFLYVALEYMKRLEGEILESLATLGETQQALEHTGLTVNPHQLLGIDINPRATAVADLVLWIGYLQWHFRTRGDSTPPIPVISNFHNIGCRDALLTWSSKDIAVDEHCNQITRWDGDTYALHPATGKQIPDENARLPVYTYKDVSRAQWPQSDFIIGNPPFIGARYIRKTLGDGYVEALRAEYSEVPKTVDYVMYWWARAAHMVSRGEVRRLGFITTNSITQDYSRRLVEAFLGDKSHPLSILFAVHDHPWIDPHSGADVRDGANVRVAMTVAAKPTDFAVPRFGVVASVTPSHESGGLSTKLVEVEVSSIASDLRPQRTEGVVHTLKGNSGMCFQGVVPAGDGFKLSDSTPSDRSLRESALPGVVRPYIIGRDITGVLEPKYIIDLFGMDETAVRRMPEIYQHLRDNVYPFRKENARKVYKEKWWIFAEPRPAMRAAIAGLRRFIVTPYTAKFRPFVFIDTEVIPDAMAYAITLSDAFHLGVLSSIVHGVWCLRAGGTLENRPRYNSKDCFDPFPFPAGTDAQQQSIRDIAERLEAHRKRQQQLQPSLTLTDMYNVLEKLRVNEELTAQEHTLYHTGLIGILREIHDELDRAVFNAYSWPHNLTTDEILARIVALNAERRAEETSGLIRWVRPDYQAANAVPVARTLEGFVTEAPAAATRHKQLWPDVLPEQVRAIKEVLRGSPAQTPQQVASAFRPASRTRVSEILTTLVALGQARVVGDRYSL